MIGRVCGTGSYLPIRTVSNDELSHVMETSDEWIRERTGIRFRHVALEETTSDMAAEAAARALKNGEVNADEIELILTATSSSDVIYPSAACIVQKRIGAQNALAFDLNGACSGFVIAFNTAQAYIRAGIYKTILVVGAESMSRLVDWSDRSTSVLFGDGAGALILKAEEGDHYWQTGHSDGTKDFVLTLRSKSLFEEQDDNPKDVLSKSDEGSSVEEHDDVSKNAEDISRKKKSHKTGICMDGQEVFKFAVRKVPELTEELLEKSGLKIADIDFFILHQANERIVKAAAKKLKVDMSRFPINMENYANTSAASIPILLDELVQTGRLRKGQKILLAGFGAGLTWAGSILHRGSWRRYRLG